MADFQKEYKVIIGGIPHTFLLSPEQAKERGLSDGDLFVKQAERPVNKSRTVQNKSDK